MRRALMLLLILVTFGIPSYARRSSSSHHYSSTSGAKTVHVRSYTTKTGKHVKAYDRRPPGTAH